MLKTDDQLTTYEEARAIAAQLGGIGGGVSDTYVPEYTGPFKAPIDGESEFYHFKFRNGADGFNAGLIQQTIALNPYRWPLMISLEVNAAAKNDTPSVVPIVAPPLPPKPADTMPIDSVVGAPVIGTPGARYQAGGSTAVPPVGTEHHSLINGVTYVVKTFGSGIMGANYWAEKLSLPAR